MRKRTIAVAALTAVLLLNQVPAPMLAWAAEQMATEAETPTASEQEPDEPADDTGEPADTEPSAGADTGTGDDATDNTDTPIAKASAANAAAGDANEASDGDDGTDETADATGTEYRVGTKTELEEAVAAIEASEEADATIVLTAGISLSSDGRFAGISGKHVTVTSADDKAYSLPIAHELEGDLTLDRMEPGLSYEYSGPLYANGHTFETTAAFTGTIHSLYGGGSKDRDVEGDTDLVLAGGSYSWVFGGGHDSAVSGSVNITFPKGGSAVAGNFYGGGHAEETASGTVSGDVNIAVLGGTLSSFTGGGYNQYASASDDRTPALVAGAVNFTAGYAGAPDSSVGLATVNQSVLGSENSTVGNVRAQLLEGVHADFDISGAGWNDDVLGTVEIYIEGADCSRILGAGQQDHRAPVVKDGYRSRILNQDSAERAVTIVVKGTVLDDTIDAMGMGYGSQVKDLVRGGALVRLEDSTVKYVLIGGTSTNYSSEYGVLEGDADIVLRGSTVKYVYGHMPNFEERTHKVNLTADSGSSVVGYASRIDTVEVKDGATLTADSEMAGIGSYNAFPSTESKGVRNVHVTGQGSTLVTGDTKTAYVWESATVETGGRWEAQAAIIIGNSKAEHFDAELKVSSAGTLAAGQMSVYGPVTISGGTVEATGQVLLRDDLILTDDGKLSTGGSKALYVYEELAIDDGTLDLKSTGNVHIGYGKTAGAKHTAKDGVIIFAAQVQIYGDIDLSGSTLTANGKFYAYELLSSEDSHLFFNAYVVVGYNHKSGAADFTCFTSENDEVVIRNGEYVDKFYGDVELDDSDVAVLWPTEVTGDWKAEGDAVLRLPVVGEGENYTDGDDGVYIPLRIDGTASGACTVLTVDREDKTQLVTPAEGDNYVIGLAPQGTSVDNPVQATFVLGNEDATSQGYYLKRVVDPANTSGNYMWQVAKEDETTWFYEVYYEFIDPDTSESEWVLCESGQGGQAIPGKTVSISHETFDGTELDWDAVDGSGLEKLGTHYVFDEGNEGNRLSALAGEATQDAPLKIYYKAATHNVTYTWADGEEAPEGIEPPAQTTKPYSAPVTIADEPAAEGWEFLGWKVESPSGLEVEEGSFLMPNEDVTLVGSWKQKHAVAYAYEGYVPEGAEALLPEGSSHVANEEVAVEAAPELEGWVFSGWTTDDVEVSGEDTFTMPDADVAFTGSWVPAEQLSPLATSLVAYEGGVGSDASGNTDALPDPEWRFEVEGWDIYIDGALDESGEPPFEFGWFDAEGEPVTSEAKAGVYYLKAWALEGEPEVIAIAEDGSAYGLNLGAEPETVLDADGEPVTCAVRDVTDDEAAEGLSESVLRPVYDAESELLGGGSEGKSALLSASSASLLSDGEDGADETLGSALEGDFSETGARDEWCGLSDEPHAHVKQGTRFLKNGDESMPVEEGAKIALLWDEPLSDVLGDAEIDAKMDAMAEQAVEGTFDTGSEVGHEMMYADLVDMEDGNLWVGTAQNDVTVFWPYPEGVDEDDELAAVYYEGLTRDYTVDMSDGDLEAAVDASAAHELSLTKTEEGVLIEVPSQQFGPLNLMWQTADETDDGTDDGTTDDGGNGSDHGGSGDGSDAEGPDGGLPQTGDPSAPVIAVCASAGLAAATAGLYAARRRRGASLPAAFRKLHP